MEISGALVWALSKESKSVCVGGVWRMQVLLGVDLGIWIKDPQKIVPGSQLF